MVAQVVVDQQMDNGVVALVRRDDAVVLGHVRELRAGVWHGAVAGEPARVFGNRAAAERFVISATPRPSAWQRALDRAIAEGIDPLAVAGLDGTFFCESGSKPGIGYLCDDRTCTCPAADRGLACKHTAACRAVLGLPVDPGNDPRPEPPAGACPECFGTTWTGDEDSGPIRCRACVPPPVLCRVCGGGGAIQHERLDPAPWECPRCCGSGLDPAAAA